MKNHQISTRGGLGLRGAQRGRWLGTFGLAAILGGALAASPVGCNGSQVTGMGIDPGGGGGDMTDTGLVDMASGGQSGYCAGSGPPIVVGDTGTSGTARCSGQVAASVFRYGLCVCQGLSASSPITVDAFDSTMPGATTFGSGGSVGINGNINVSNTLSVGGTLQSANSSVGQALKIGQDLLLGGGMNQSGVDVARNAKVAGDIVVNGTLKVVGNLTYGKTLTATTQQIGSKTMATVTVAAPCDCAQNQIFPIASYVDARRTNNDNASIGLDPARLNNFQSDQTLDLPCGRFFLNNISGSAKLTVKVTGRTALFIGGDVNLQSNFTVQVGGTGELDLFINGGLTSSAALNFGDASAPARVRLYMGGSRNINLSGNAVINGNIYAPESALVTSGSLTVAGSIFVNSFNPSNTVTIHHDIAVLKAADSCTPTSGGGGGGTTTNSCSKCQDCGGQACVSGMCGTCTMNSDCCAPLSCDRGKCAYVAG